MVRAEAVAARHLADFVVSARLAHRHLRELPSLDGSWPRSASTERLGDLWEVAYGNGFYSHALDWDDVLVNAAIHPGPVIYGALLAAAQVTSLSPSECCRLFLRGIGIALDLSEVLEPAHYSMGWHSTATIGRAAAAYATAIAVHADEQAAQRAVHLAAVTGGGLTDSFGTIAKPIQVGAATASAVQAAILAGYNDDIPKILTPGTRSADIFGLSGSPQLGTSNPADAARFLRVKEYPVCYFAQPAIQGIEKANRMNERPVAVAVSPQADRILTAEKPTTLDQARFALPWLVAAAWDPPKDGALGLLDGTILDSPSFDGRADSLSFSVDESLGCFAARVATASGETFEVDLSLRDEANRSRQSVLRKASLVSDDALMGWVTDVLEAPDLDQLTWDPVIGS